MSGLQYTPSDFICAFIQYTSGQVVLYHEERLFLAKKKNYTAPVRLELTTL